MITQEYVIGPGSGNIIIPPDPGLDSNVVRHVIVEVWGAGAGGSNPNPRNSPLTGLAGGGGGGAYMYLIVEIANRPTTVAYVLGLRGRGSIGSYTGVGTIGAGTNGGSASAIILGFHALAGGGQGCTNNGAGGVPGDSGVPGDVYTFPTIQGALVGIGYVSGGFTRNELAGIVDYNNDRISVNGGGASSAIGGQFAFSDNGLPGVLGSPIIGYSSDNLIGAGRLQRSDQSPPFGTGGAGSGGGNPTSSSPLNGTNGSTPGGGGGGAGTIVEVDIGGFGSVGDTGIGGDGGNAMVCVTWFSNTGERKRDPKSVPEPGELPVPIAVPSLHYSGQINIIGVAETHMVVKLASGLIIGTENNSSFGGGLLPSVLK